MERFPFFGRKNKEISSPADLMPRTEVKEAILEPQERGIVLHEAGNIRVALSDFKKAFPKGLVE